MRSPSVWNFASACVRTTWVGLFPAVMTLAAAQRPAPVVMGRTPAYSLEPVSAGSTTLPSATTAARCVPLASLNSTRYTVL